MTVIEMPNITYDQAIKIDYAIDRFFKAINSKREVLRINDKLMESSYKFFSPFVDEYMKFTNKSINDALRKKYIRKSVEFKKDKAINITTKLLDWEKLNENGVKMLKPATLAIMAESGNTANKIAGIEGAFDIINPEAVAAVNKIALNAVVEVGKETKLAINDIIRQGIIDGKSMGKVAKELRPLVGLTERQVGAVDKYKKWLDVKRTDLSALQKQKWVERYQKKLHKYRTETIARTESARSVNEGARLSYKNTGYKTLKWSANVGCCSECAEKDGQEFTVEEAEGMIPLHPRGRCSWLAESKRAMPKTPKVPKVPKFGMPEGDSMDYKIRISKNKKLLDQASRIESRVESKLRISKEIYGKLKNNNNYMDIVELYQKSRTQEAAIKFNRNLLDTWARTSADNDPLSVAMQLAAHDEFNLKDDIIYYAKDIINKAKSQYYNGKSAEVLKSFLRAQYNLTQEYFKKNGIKSLTVYRGVASDELMSGMKSLKYKGESEIKNIVLQPISSFSTNHTEAIEFFWNIRPGKYQILIQTEVPSERIMSTCMTGYGGKPQAEVVALGGTEKVKIISKLKEGTRIRFREYLDKFAGEWEEPW